VEVEDNPSDERKFPTIQAWLISRVTRDIPLYQIARALGVRSVGENDGIAAIDAGRRPNGIAATLTPEV
jgi:hypothetical protein